jgi:hypothetical protein
MIIILEPQKDTYVTNLKTVKNDGAKANVGQAATLDLFKLYNENKNSHSWAAFKFTGSIADEAQLRLIDADNKTVDFIFKTDEDTVDGSLNNSKVIIGISEIDDEGDSNPSTYAAQIAAAINNVSTFNNDLTLGITAFSNSNNELVLKQNKAGLSGDTTFTVPANMVHVGTTNTDTVTKFTRIDYSAVLIKFDLDDFKSNWIELIDDDDGDGIDDGGAPKDDLPGAFRNLKAELILKDVTTGTTKPKDFNLEVCELKKDFLEGLGKDTVHFSDKSNTNFQSFDDTTNWEIESYITLGTAVDAELFSPTSSFTVSKGNEDVVFDISNYIKEKLKQTSSTINDKGLLIKFTNSFLYNIKSYFAKRLGSRHLINKALRPELRIKIDDSSYNIPIDSFNKKRYLNNLEEFYLFNILDGELSDFIDPDDGVSFTLKLKIKSKDNKKVFANVTANSTSGAPVVNFKGKKLSGIRKAQLTNTDLSKFNNEISSYIKNDKLEANYEWCWYKETDQTTTINAGDFIEGRTYKIKTKGTTDFTLIGASDNVVGIVFTATGAGTGNGTAYQIEKVIKNERVDFYISENANEERYENLISSIKINENKLISDNSSCSVEVYFVDTKKEFNAVKVPFELPSENIGNVFYQLIDVESGKTLIDYDKGTSNTSQNATKMFFDGEKYRFNFYVPKKYKDARVNFKFMYEDPITKTKKYIFNEKYSVRIL